MALCNMCIFQLQVSQDDMETAHALEQVCDYSVEEMHSHKKELVQIISRHLSSDNARVLFPLGKWHDFKKIGSVYAQTTAGKFWGNFLTCCIRPKSA